MAIGLVGRKLGMSRVFTDTGTSIPVTVVEVLPNRITQLKSLDKEGYTAIQITTGKKASSRVNKPEAGHFAKAQEEAGRGLWEFTYNPAEGKEFNVGQALTVDLFQPGQRVDVTGTSKGKGFAGAIKRHNFRSQDMSHGNSVSHRAPGSIGQNQTPGRVFKGKRMAGHLGDERCTVQNIEVVRVDPERHLLLIKGAIPGCNTGNVIIKPTVKTTVSAEVTA
jgi:large subunit ribosomal protein L3